MGIVERAADLAEIGRVGQREAQLFPRNRSFPEALTRIAVLIPCYNEALTIGAVVRDFRAALPDAESFVYDNNSRDGTSAAARAGGGGAPPGRGRGGGTRSPPGGGGVVLGGFVRRHAFGLSRAVPTLRQ